MVGGLSGKKIGVLGLSFKPETADMRESPAIDIVHALVKAGASVRAFDPVAMDEAKHYINGIEYATDEYDALQDADVLVIVTEWNQFRALDMAKVKGLLKTPKIADLRNIYEPRDMRAMGFEYVGVGR
jgi:UDPglucose 6-dehydrogenase